MATQSPAIEKSSRHSRITGDFAEALVLYWLSKHGFECARVDHTGIDLIAKHPRLPERMGISVKSRSRNPGTGTSNLAIEKEHLKKCELACMAFGCTPWFAIVVDADQKIEVYIVPEDCFRDYALPQGHVKCSWKMRPEWKQKYGADSRVIRFEMTYNTTNWWKEEPTSVSVKNRVAHASLTPL